MDNRKKSKSAETIKKIKEATRLAMQNPEVKEKLRLGKLGKRGNRLGKKMSPEQLERHRVSHLGQKAWNKGISGYFQHTEEHKASLRIKMLKEGNPFWSGEDVGYMGLHQRVRRLRGKAYKCENKICKGRSTTFEWANISKKYLKVEDDFMMLCRSCHRKYDYGSLTLEEIRGVIKR